MDAAEYDACEDVTARAAEVALRDPNAFIELFVRDEKNRPIVQAQLHRDMQAEWTRSKYSVMAVPREHGKTTQALARVAWEIVNNANLRVKIVAATDPHAADRVEVIRRILEQERLQQAYPWVQFAKTRSQSRGQFSVVRSASLALDPTVKGVGILGQETGGRADLILMDDPVTMRNALTIPMLRGRVKDAFFADYFPMVGKGKLWYIGTPWHESDLTSFLIAGREVEKGPDIFRRAVSDDLVSPWLEAWPRERLEERKAQWPAAAFARAFYLRPLSEEDAVCHEAWIESVDVPASDTVVLGIDPASSKQGKTDYTAIAILEIHEGFALLRDMVRIRAVFPEQIRQIMELQRTLKARYVAVETVGVQGWMAEELTKQGCRQVVGASPRGNKGERFRVLGLRFKQGTLKLPTARTSGLTAFLDELLGFPAAEHDDTLDATAYAMKVSEDAHLVEPGAGTLGEVPEDYDSKRNWSEIGLDFG